MPADGTPAEREPAADAPPVAERRKNVLFRSLIDEMMVQFRELKSHSGPWPDEERDRAEADLDRILSQVRAEAFRTVD
jgi:hypothetical protein